MQPRSRFDEVKLRELAQSVRANGIVQALLVRPKGNRYELIAGERRWRAAKLAGLETVPVMIRDVPDAQLLEIALIENIQREDLNPIEEAQALSRLVDTVGITQEILAARIGRDRSYVSNYLRLLRLPPDIQDLLQDGKISPGHARALLGVTDPDHQRRLARKVIERGWSVREIEREMRDATGSKKKASSALNDANVRALESKLRRQLGTQVRIRATSETSGTIEIHYHDLRYLDQICSALVQGTSAHAI
jgi:ParB family chromosome partitioning protein